MEHWQNSFGFRSIIAAGIIYFLGLFFSIVFDIKSKKNIKTKLLRDFRNIDRYGLKEE